MTKIYFWFCILLAVFLLSCRPVHAATSFTVTASYVPTTKVASGNYMNAYWHPDGIPSSYTYGGNVPYSLHYTGTWGYQKLCDAYASGSTYDGGSFCNDASAHHVLYFTVGPSQSALCGDNYNYTAPNCVRKSSGLVTLHGTCTTTTCNCDVNYQVGADGQSCVLPGRFASTPPKKGYQLKIGGGSLDICLADGSCPAAQDLVYSSPAAACNAWWNYPNSNEACTLVGGNVCYCSGVDGFGEPFTDAIPIIDVVACPDGDLNCQNAKQLAQAEAIAGSAATLGGVASGLSAASAVEAAQQQVRNNIVTWQAASAVGVSLPTGGGSSASVTVNIPPDLARTGDVVDLRDQLKTKLDQIKDAITAQSGIPDLGAVPAAETVPSETPVFSTAPLPFAESAGCPATIDFVIGGSLTAIAGTYHLSFAPVCDVMTTLRPVFLSLAAISAAFIFAAGLTL